MSSRQFVRNAFKVFLFAITAGSFIFFYGNSVIARDGVFGVTLERSFRWPSAMQRERYLASRHGLQFGVPQHAFEHAAAQIRAMAANRGAKAGLASPALSGTWTSIGPVPSSEKANFNGVPIGSNVAMTGRISAVAADSHGLIVAGAAAGGVWVSTDNGANFTSTFDNEA